MSNIEQLIDQANSALNKRLPQDTTAPTTLHQAMRYSALLGGKRIRPLLVYASSRLFGLSGEMINDAAVAVELIHAYSLIHDDLPAMDDDSLRRGQPTCHIAFDEATAILAGDALQAYAFEVLLKTDLPDEIPLRHAMCSRLSKACGSLGMAGGQALDLAATGQAISMAELETMHQLKTGALIQASVAMGYLAANIQDQDLVQRLDRFSTHLGLAFQVRDDILDVEGETEHLGKKAGADQALGKSTYPAIIGLEASHDHAKQLYDQAISEISIFGEEADLLRELAELTVSRSN